MTIRSIRFDFDFDSESKCVANGRIEYLKNERLTIEKQTD